MNARWRAGGGDDPLRGAHESAGPRRAPVAAAAEDRGAGLDGARFSFVAMGISVCQSMDKVWFQALGEDPSRSGPRRRGDASAPRRQAPRRVKSASRSSGLAKIAQREQNP